MNETCLEAINSNVHHFIHHNHLGYNITKPANWLTAENLPSLIILIADLVKKTMTLTFHILIFLSA